MLYLTLEDDPFPDQQHDEKALLELVHSVARRNGDDRCVSELVRFQDALERLGLLWTPLDSLDKYQALELVRHIHLELAAPGDMVYVKHSPAMRSYVVLRGTVLLTNNVLDREGTEGVRALRPGQEFGHPLDPCLDLNTPVADFLEYARVPHLDPLHKSGGEVDATRGGNREDGRAELLVIGRQDWISSLQSCRSYFAKFTHKYDASKDPDPLKSEARVAFNFPAKGRRGKHLETATKYLTERVTFCLDLPPEQVSALAAAVELRGLAVPGRHILRRGRECYGEAYIMFTGTADQKGGDKSGDRLIKEGDLFGDEYFTVSVKDDLATRFRTASVISRTAPCELLVLPARECRSFHSFVALRNSERAMAIFEKFFINLPRDTSSEIASLVTFRTIKMHQTLAVAGDEVSEVFFLFRGECISKSSNQHHQRHVKDDLEVAHRYGPGDIVGWQSLMSDTPALGLVPTSASRGGSATTPQKAAFERDVEDRVDELHKNVAERVEMWRPRRNMKEWHSTVTVTTPAQVLSVPSDALLSALSENAMAGLRMYIALTHKQKSEEASASSRLGALGDDDSFGGGYAVGYEYDSGISTPVLGYNAGGMLMGHPKVTATSSFADRLRPSTAADEASMECPLFPENKERRRPDTTALTREAGVRKEGITSRANGFCVRPSTTRWRWRVGLWDSIGGRISTASRGSQDVHRSLESAPSSTSSSVAWGFERRRDRGLRGKGVRREQHGGHCSCPMESCRVCSPLRRLERLRKTPAWAPSLPSRPMKHGSERAASSAGAWSKSIGGAMTTANNTGTNTIVKNLSMKRRPSTCGASATVYVHRTPKALFALKTAVAAAVDTAASEEDTRRGALWSHSGKAWDTGRGTAVEGLGDADIRKSMGDTEHKASVDVGFHNHATPSADRREGVVTATDAAVAAKLAFGVTTASTTSSTKGEGVDAADAGSDVSFPPATAAVVPDLPSRVRLSYTLLQLSTRAALNPPEASAKLFMRILGSFTSEADATTRVSRLYHSVLPPSKLIWLPYPETTAIGTDELASAWFFSDHLFLLRKGVPVGRLSFEVEDDGTEKSRTNEPDDSKNGRNDDDDDDDDDDNNNAGFSSIKLEGTGRGYDARFPAVFKAKGQQFAVAFASAADSVENEFALYQRKMLEVRQRAPTAADPGVAAAKTLNTAQPRSRDTESTSWVSNIEGSDNGGSGESVLRLGRAAPLVECELDEDVRVLDAAGIVELNGAACSTSGEATVGRHAEIYCSEVRTGVKAAAAVAEQDEVKADRGDSSSLAVDHGADGSGQVDGSGSRDCSGNAVSTHRRGLTDNLDPLITTPNGAKKGEEGNDHEDNPGDDAPGQPSGAKHEKHVRGTRRETASGALSGSFFNELLDSSGRHSSDDDDEHIDSRWTRNRSNRSTADDRLYLDDNTSDDTGSGEVDSGTSSRGESAALSWIINRMGTLEQVEGCYETEAKAFKRTVEILEGKGTALSSTRMADGPRHIQEQEEPDEIARARLFRQRQPLEPLDNIACIFPLYEWISLGDGGIIGVTTVIGNRSIADPLEAERAGVDPYALWTQQRARRLRTHLYNLLRAAGPREIRSRCGFASTEDGWGKSRRGNRAGRCRGGGRGAGGGGLGDDALGGIDFDFHSLGREKAAKEAVRSARAAVLRKNQRLIQTEMDARRQLIKPSSTDTVHSQEQQQDTRTLKASISTEEGGGVSNAKLQEKSRMTDDGGVVERTATWLGLGGEGDRGDPGGCQGKEGLRHMLRVQMIERKRARLFEDIRALPYIRYPGTNTSISATKKGKSTKAVSSSSKVSHKPDSCSKRILGEGRQRTEATTYGPPAIVFRAPKVKAQIRLHGRPASPFFARANTGAAGAALAAKMAASAAGVLGENNPRVSSLSSSFSLLPPPTSLLEHKVAKGVTVVDTMAKHHPAESATMEKNTIASIASAASAESSANNISAWESYISNPGDEQGTIAGSTSVQETSIESSNNEDATRCNTSKPCDGKSTTASSGRNSRKGCRGVGGRASKGWDSRSSDRIPPGVCSLSGELMLLDGILHDRELRAWVETTLVPTRRDCHQST